MGSNQVLEQQPRDTRVFWSIKKLAREYDLSGQKITRILKSIGAKRWSDRAFYYELEE